MLEEIDEGIPVDPENLKQMGREEAQHCSRRCGPRGGSRQPTRALTFRSLQEVFPGPDRKIRVVRVRTGGKDHVRPITNLCPLEM